MWGSVCIQYVQLSCKHLPLWLAATKFIIVTIIALPLVSALGCFVFFSLKTPQRKRGWWEIHAQTAELKGSLWAFGKCGCLLQVDHDLLAPVAHRNYYCSPKLLNNLINLHLELNLKVNQTAATHMNASLLQPDAGLYPNALVGFTTAPGKLELSSICWLCFYTHI